MVRISARRRKHEAGQAILLVVLAMSIVLLGSLGFVIDGSHLYAQRVMAQAAADAAAQAGIMSISNRTAGAFGTYATFDGANWVTSGGTPLTSGSIIPCSTSGMSTSAACTYAQILDGFNLAGDAVTVTINPTATVCPSNSCLSSSDPINLLQVTVQRTVNTTFMQLLGSSAATIKAVGIGGITQVPASPPLLVTHPTMAGALSMNGSITICGGGTQSIQINSSNPAAFSGSSGIVDLSHAGPKDTGNCTAGTGASFGVWGGPTTNPGNVNLGTLPGRYISPSSPIQDPLAGVPAPSVPSGATMPSGGQLCSILGHCGDCPASRFSGAQPSSCQEYVPGVYASIDTTGINSAIFDPGVYYVEGGGFKMADSTAGMCVSCTADLTTGNGMLVYDTCAGAQPCAAGSDPTGGFNINANAYAALTGANIPISLANAPGPPYYGILFFEDRKADARSHTIGAGSGCFSQTGIIYITNTLGIMTADSSHYQSVAYQATPCTGVRSFGDIIVSQLTVTSGVLGLFQFSTNYLTLRQVSLVD